MMTMARRWREMTRDDRPPPPHPQVKQEKVSLENLLEQERNSTPLVTRPLTLVN